MSSEGEDYLNSEDVNEEYSFDEGEYFNGENGGEKGRYSENGSENDGENDGENDQEFHEEFQQKYAEELEFEDFGEPATFNFNIHKGNLHFHYYL